MKKLIALTFALTSLIACNKDEDNEESIPPTVRGEWILYERELRTSLGQLVMQEKDEKYNFKANDSVAIGWFNPYKIPYRTTEDSLYITGTGYRINNLTLNKMVIYTEFTNSSEKLSFERE